MIVLCKINKLCRIDAYRDRVNKFLRDKGYLFFLVYQSVTKVIIFVGFLLYICL